VFNFKGLFYQKGGAKIVMYQMLHFKKEG